MPVAHPLDPIAPFADAFTALLTREVAAGRTKIEGICHDLTEERDSILTGLEKCRERLATLFSDPATTGDLTKITQELDAQFSWINRKLRPGLDRKIRSLSPRKRPLAASMNAVQEKIVELIPLLPAGHPLPTGAGMVQEGMQRLVNRIALSPQELARELLPEGTAEHPLILRHSELHEEAVGKLADFWRGLRFHFELLIDELEEAAKSTENGEEASVVVEGEGGGKREPPAQSPELAAQILDALTAGHDLLARTFDPLLTFYQAFPVAMEKEYLDWLQRYRTELARHTSPQQIVHQLALRLSRPARHWRETARSLLDQGVEEVSRTTTSGLHQTGTFLRNLQDLVGRGDGTAAALHPYYDLPDMEEVFAGASDLPPHYRRLFTLGPLKNREFLVGREEEMESLGEIFERWKGGKVCNVAVVGPEGSGKTSLLNCFVSEFGTDEEIVNITPEKRICTRQGLIELLARKLQIEEGTTAADLQQGILAGPRRIVILEGGHLLATREAGGTEPLSALLSLMAATREHLLWLVTFRHYPFARLDYLLGLGSLFTHTVRTLFHDKDELLETLLMRHRTSGLPLRFTATREEDEEKQEELKNRYFRDLFAATAGNIDAALYFWLRSLQFDAATASLSVAPLFRPDPRVLRALGREQLFSLGEVMAHGGLSAQEHARLFRRPEADSAAHLAFLAQLNLLRESGEGDAPLYHLNPVFFGPVSTLLESMNILY